MQSPHDLTGVRFGRLVALERAPAHPTQTAAFWHCLCDCGTEKVFSGPNLRRGNTRSCGCLRREMMRAKQTKHGRHGSRAYTAWQGMKRRCYNKRDKHFRDYGGRGIRVCARWRDNFSAFLSDMGEPPPGHSIDRVENGGDYEPGNCRWADLETQANNKRNNRLLTINGRTQAVPLWAAEADIAASTIHRRLGLGWAPELAVFSPVNKNLRRVFKKLLEFP